MEVPIQEAERSLSALLQSAAEGQDVVITRDGLPVGRLVPVARPDPISDEDVVAGLSPAARRLWQNRSRLEGVTVAELLAESRRDQR